MGFLTKPRIDQVNPNPPQVQGLQGDIAGFLSGVFGGGASPFANLTSNLQRQSTDAIGEFMRSNPEQQTLDMLQPGLMELFGGGSAAGIGQAALPVFQRQLQQSLGGLSSSAPGRFGTAFQSQGIDLASRAAQDFALLEAQARQQEVGNRLGAAGLLGTLSGQAGQNQFGRLLGAGQLGLGQTQAAIDPMLRLMLGGLGFAQPQAMDTVVGDSPLDSLLKGGALAATLFSGGGSGGIPAAPSAFPSPDPKLVLKRNWGG